jgi:hypothetical protein
VSNYAKEAHLDGRVILGPEVVNGTGGVYLDVPGILHLKGDEVRVLAAALIDAADYAAARQADADA